jgi:hypothetical protein
MSRVFEALARADEEKHRQVQLPVEKLESTATVEIPVEEKGSTPKNALQQTVRSVEPMVRYMKLTKFIRWQRTANNRGTKESKTGS